MTSRRTTWSAVTLAMVSVVLLAACYLQIFVHVLPGIPSTDTRVFGLHWYPIAYLSLTAGFVYSLFMLWLMP
jgi:hypothetical protein